MGLTKQKKEMTKAELFALQQGEAEVNSYQDHMFAEQFDQGQYSQGESLIEYYEQRGAKLTKEEKEALMNSPVPAPKFEVLSEEAYRGKNVCGRSSYRGKVKKYYKERNERRLTVLEGEDEAKRVAYNEAIYNIENRLMNPEEVQEDDVYESIEATMNEKALKDDVYAPIEAMITEKAGKKVNLDIDVKGDGLYELDNLKEMTDLPNQESKDMLRVNIYLKKMEKIDKKKRQWYDKMLKLLEDDSDISNEAAEKIERELGLDKIKVSGSQTDPEYAEQFQGAIRLSNKIRTYLLFGDDANKTDEERQEKEDYNLARERLVDTVDYCESDETKEFLKKIKDNYFNLMDTKPRQHLESPFMKKVQAENQKLIDQKKAIELEKEKKAKEEKEKEEKLKEVKQEETEKPAEKENKEEKPKVIKRKVQAVRQPERNLTQEEIRENSIKRINETFEETKNRIEEEIKKTGQARVMDERKKNSSDKKKWDEDCLTYDDDCYRGYQYSNENIQISEIKPKLSDLRQTSGSTCYLYSALAGIVATNPGYITNELIRDDPKDQAFCIVKLYDAKSRVNYIRVRKSYEKRTFNWSHLVFKAATVLIEKDENKAVFRVGDVPHGKLEINDLDLGDEQLASRLFLGTKGKLLDLRDRVPDDKLDEFNAGEDVTHDGQECIDGDKAIGTLLAYINVGKMVVASTCTNDYAGDGKYHYKGDRVKFSCPLLNEKHAYRVVGEGTPDPITKERKLRLWDPLRSGEIEITFEDFKKHFTYGMIMDTRENDLYNKNNWKADEEDIEEEENLDEEENIEVEEEREEEEKRLKEEEKRLKEEEEKRLKEEEESRKKEEERRHIEEVAQKMREEFERSQEEQRKKEEEKKRLKEEEESRKKEEEKKKKDPWELNREKELDFELDRNVFAPLSAYIGDIKNKAPEAMSDKEKNLIEFETKLKKFSVSAKKLKIFSDKMKNKLMDTSDLSNEAALKIEKELGLLDIELKNFDISNNFSKEYYGAMELQDKILEYTSNSEDSEQYYADMRDFAKTVRKFNSDIKVRNELQGFLKAFYDVNKTEECFHTPFFEAVKKNSKKPNEEKERKLYEKITSDQSDKEWEEERAERAKEVSDLEDRISRLEKSDPEGDELILTKRQLKYLKLERIEEIKKSDEIWNEARVSSAEDAGKRKHNAYKRNHRLHDEQDGYKSIPLDD